MKRILSLLLAFSLIGGACTKPTDDLPPPAPPRPAGSSFAANAIQRTNDILLTVTTPMISNGTLRYNFRLTFTDSTAGTYQVLIPKGYNSESKVITTNKKLAHWKIVS